MKMRKGSVVRLSEEGKASISDKDVFLHTRSYYTAKYFIAFGSVTFVIFEEDKNGCNYLVDWFEIVAEKNMPEDIIVNVDDIIGKQDYIPSEIHELCDLLTSWNGYIIEKEGIGEW